jgi:putative inorganic carbon (HCO3(-)) transporter
MRDIVLLAIMVAGVLAALRWPWVGVMLWTWVSTLNPHRFTYGFAYDMPFAAAAAGVTLVALLLTRDRESPFKGPPVTLLAVFIVWISISWVLGLDPAKDYDQWNKVMKIYLMILVTLALLRTKTHIFAFIWVSAGSLALLGAKGGVFTIATAGSHRVWGPPGTFIAENNAFAVALVMTIPLMRFMQMQFRGRWARHGMTLLMVLIAASALGSQSRGALLALTAMAGLMWWRQKHQRVLGAVVMVVAAGLLLAFMPESWEARMTTIKTYEEDLSAMGRIAAWWVAWGVSFDYPFGVGFNAARPELFFKYSPYVHLLGGHSPVAHSIYFQMLGHHGWVGLFLFLAIGFSTWRVASRIRRQADVVPEARWCGELAGMAQVSLIGYAVGGAFLDLAYFDLPYNVMVMLVLTHVWVASRAWEREPATVQSRWRIPGVAGPMKRHLA